MDVKVLSDNEALVSADLSSNVGTVDAQIANGAEIVKGVLSNAILAGADGKSAYEVAVKNGYQGTELEWLKSLHGKDGASVGSIAIKITENDWQGDYAPYVLAITPEHHGMGATQFLIAFTLPENESDKEFMQTYDSPVSDVNGIIRIWSRKKWRGYVYICGGITENVDYEARQAIQNLKVTFEII